MKLNKHAFSILFLLMSYYKNGLAAESSKTNYPDIQIDPVSLINLKTSNSDENSIIDGSAEFKKCQKMAGGDLTERYEEIKKSGGVSSDSHFDWVGNTITAYCDKALDAFKKEYNSNPEAAITNFSNNCTVNKISIKKISPQIAKCEAMLSVMAQNGRDLKNQNHTKSVQVQQNNNQSVIVATQGSVGVQNSDSYNCKSAGVETIDYDACKKFSDYSQGLELATKAAVAGQNIYYANKAIDTSYEAQKNMNTDATAALKAQKTNFKDQQEVFTQNSAIEATKLATLATIKSEVPTQENLNNNCNNAPTVTFASSTANFSVDAKEACLAMTTRNPAKGFSFLMNEDSREKMNKKLIQLGVNAATEGTKAIFAGKRADQVGDAIAKVNSFTPTTTAGLAQDVQSTYCQMNPTATQCVNSQAQQFNAIDGNIVDFGQGSTGVYTTGGTTTTDNGISTGTSSGTTNNDPKSTNTIGAAITNVDKGGEIIDPAARATITNASKMAAQGSGGGGGGGGGGGTGGGGGGNAAGGNSGSADAKVSSAIQGKAASYAGGGGISTLGKGLGSSTKKADSANNPFGNMFDKKTAGNDKLINFRGPASVAEKGDNIFEIIHRRYGWANEKKMMLEYDEVTK